MRTRLRHYPKQSGNRATPASRKALSAGGAVDAARMRRSCLGVLFSLVGVLGGAASAAAGCTLRTFLEFPVTMQEMRALVSAKMNETDVQMIVDSGAFYSMLNPASAKALKLKLSPAPYGFYVKGSNGAADVDIATVKTFTLANLPLHDIQFLVGGTDMGAGSPGVLGQNFLHLHDVEYDLGQGAVRLMRADNCDKYNLAYWAEPSRPVQVIPLLVDSEAREAIQKLAPTIGPVYVNGVKLRALFDTGAPTSIVSAKGAAAAGITVASPGVVHTGHSGGIGKGSYATYVAPVASFKVGDEEIKNTRLRFGEIDTASFDMLLGADFFLSHRIFVANSLRKIFLTYNGGPVFRLDNPTSTGDAPAADADAGGPSTTVATGTDAGEFSRRGNAYAARREFDLALPALNRACELAPDNPQYRYQRGAVYLQTGQREAAMADFDKTLELDPNEGRARLARAKLWIAMGKAEPALIDLSALDAMLPAEANERYELAELYQRAGRPGSSVQQITKWIDAHPVDARLASALADRCSARAIEGTGLDLALADCNAAVRRADHSTPVFAEASEARGFVYLLKGECDKAIADYDAALTLQSRNAPALYGRGICKRRKGLAAAGDGDIAMAKIASPEVEAEFAALGIHP